MSHYWSACPFFKEASFFLTAFIPAELPSTFSKIQVKRNTFFSFASHALQAKIPCGYIKKLSLRKSRLVCSLHSSL